MFFLPHNFILQLSAASHHVEDTSNLPYKDLLAKYVTVSSQCKESIESLSGENKDLVCKSQKQTKEFDEMRKERDKLRISLDNTVKKLEETFTQLEMYKAQVLYIFLYK